MSRGRGRRDNELIGQTVRISQGPYKGEQWGAGRQGLCWREFHPPDCPLPYRLHWCGEGCHRVHSPSGAALYLSDHLCGPPAAHYGVCLGLGKASVGLMVGLREEQHEGAGHPTHSACSVSTATPSVQVAWHPPTDGRPCMALRHPCMALAPEHPCMAPRHLCRMVSVSRILGKKQRTSR